VGVARFMLRRRLTPHSRVPDECSERACASGTSSGTQRKARAAPYPLQQPHIMSPLGPGSLLAYARSGWDRRAPRPNPLPCLPQPA
jgi:hypothetical protein